MKSLDGEITPEEQRLLDQHLEECASCRREMESFKKLKQETGAMKEHLIPDLAWEDYWHRLYNRLERGLSWILISLGAVILLVYGGYQAVTEIIQTTDMPVVVKWGMLALMAGIALLLVSVIREKLLLRKHDKYKEVRR